MSQTYWTIIKSAERDGVLIVNGPVDAAEVKRLRTLDEGNHRLAVFESERECAQFLATVKDVCFIEYKHTEAA